MERTLIILKPDCIQRGLVGQVLSRFEARGFSIAGMKFVKLTHALLEEHYSHLKGKPFFPALVEFMSSTPVVVAAIEGDSGNSLSGMPTIVYKTSTGSSKSITISNEDQFYNAIREAAFMLYNYDNVAGFTLFDFSALQLKD